MKYHAVAERNPKMFSNALSNNKSPDGRRLETLHTLRLTNHSWFSNVPNYHSIKWYFINEVPKYKLTVINIATILWGTPKF